MTDIATDHRLLVFRPANHEAIVLASLGNAWDEAQNPGALLSDECFEDGELTPPGDGLWVFDGSFRVEPAGWAGPSWQEGGAYLNGYIGEGWGRYPHTWRRPNARELELLRTEGVAWKPKNAAQNPPNGVKATPD